MPSEVFQSTVTTCNRSRRTAQISGGRQPRTQYQNSHPSAAFELLGAAAIAFPELSVEDLLVRLLTLLVPVYAIHPRKPVLRESTFVWGLNLGLSK